MSAHIAKQSDRLFTPNTLAYGAIAVQQRRGVSLFERVSHAVRWVAEIPTRRAVIDELQRLSDRELADIGLNRGELNKVFSRR